MIPSTAITSKTGWAGSPEVPRKLFADRRSEPCHARQDMTWRLGRQEPRLEQTAKGIFLRPQMSESEVTKARRELGLVGLGPGGAKKRMHGHEMV